MSQQVEVDRLLRFNEAAGHQGNVDGALITKLKMFDEGFFGDASEHDWNEGESYGGTIAHAVVDGGAETITLGGTDEDCGELYHSAQWSPYYNCGMLAKLKISAITNVCVTVGLVDVPEDTNDHVAGEIDLAAFRIMSKTADWVGFTFDTDQTTKVWYVGASKNGTEGTPVAAVGSLAPVADTYFYVCVKTDKDGNVLFYYGTKIDRLNAVGRLYTATTGAIAHTVSDVFAPYIGFIAHTATALVCTVSRVIVWQDN